jgi:hypothetical protein
VRPKKYIYCQSGFSTRTKKKKINAINPSGTSPKDHDLVIGPHSTRRIELDEEGGHSEQVQVAADRVHSDYHRARLPVHPQVVLRAGIGAAQEKEEEKIDIYEAART